MKTITLYRSPSTHRWTYGRKGIFNNVPPELCNPVADYPGLFVRTFQHREQAEAFAENRGYSVN